MPQQQMVASLGFYVERRVILIPESGIFKKARSVAAVSHHDSNIPAKTTKERSTNRFMNKVNSIERVNESVIRHRVSSSCKQLKVIQW